MGQNRNWTREEELYLAENWGRMTIAGLCKKLDRSETAIIVRVRRMGLPPYLESGDYITLNQLCLALHGQNVDTYMLTSWVKRRKMPVHMKRRGKFTYRVVYLEEFWEWAEKNRSFLDFSKMEPLALGKEPDWLVEQRHKDFQAYSIQRKDHWTDQEDSHLKALLKLHRYGYAELSEILHRSEGAIQRRCNDLGLKERPVKAETHGTAAKWTEDMYQRLADGIRSGDSYAVIGRHIGKSEKAVRSKVYTAYLTEDADKVRAMMGTGPWGGWSSNPDGEAGHISYRPVSGGKKGPGHHRRDTAAEGRCNGLGSVLAAEDVPALGRLQGLRGRLRELRHLHGVQAHRAAVLLPLWARLL